MTGWDPSYLGTLNLSALFDLHSRAVALHQRVNTPPKESA